jgi:beta-glucanase (GH16 family)
MVAFWMSGIEDTPQHSGEICVMEVFGNAVRAGAGFAGSLDAGAGGSADVGAGGSADVGIGGSADVGIGVKNFRDPALRWDFTADPQEIDISDFHTYGVDWRPGSLSFTVDGKPVRQVDRSPNYPVQLMIGVFDFPDRADPSTSEIPVPELVVSHVIGHPLGA